MEMVEDQKKGRVEGESQTKPCPVLLLLAIGPSWWRVPVGANTTYK
jgi:hypothetical protein